MSTTNVSRLRVTPDSDLLALAPEKPRRFLDKALRRGLTVWQSTNASVTGGQAWTIESANPIDDWQLWLYFQAGARGGRLTITRYTPSVSGRLASVKLTQAMAGIAIDDMGDSLDRHNARVAQAQSAMRQLGSELDGAIVPDAPATSARLSAVRAVKAAPALIEARAALDSLKVNGRFALRMARTGAIPRTTTGTVRAALANRDLVSQAGGVLTDLGRAVRELIMNPEGVL